MNPTPFEFFEKGFFFVPMFWIWEISIPAIRFEISRIYVIFSLVIVSFDTNGVPFRLENYRYIRTYNCTSGVRIRAAFLPK